MRFQQQRKLLNPVFRNVRVMVPNFWSKAMRITGEIRQTIMMTNQNSAVFDVSQLTQKVTFGMIMSTTFALNIEEHPQKESDLLNAWKAATLHGESQNLLETILEGVLPFFVPPQYTSWLLDHTPRNQRSIRGRKAISDFSKDQIKAVKSAMADSKDISKTKGKCAASMLTSIAHSVQDLPASWHGWWDLECQTKKTS
jgi:hypothetical protein